MVNFATVIEGACWKLSVRSDLSRSYSCQYVPKTPMKVGEPWETIGHAANYAGRWINIPDGDYLTGGSGATLRAASLRKPATEKEARLRSQQFISKWSINHSLEREIGSVSQRRYGLGPFYFRGGITACSHNATGTSRLGGQEAAPVPPLDFL